MGLVEYSVPEISKSGLINLESFLANRIDFEELKPFPLPITFRKVNMGTSALFSYYLGERTGKSRFLSFTIPISTAGKLNEIYVLPKSEIKKGEHPYFWLEFYPADLSSEEAPEILKSCRLQPMTEHIMDFNHWHNIEEQLLSDYILQLNNIQFTDLVPFRIDGAGNTLGSYRISARQELALNISGNPLLANAVGLWIIPREDDQKFYQWVDVLKMIPGIDKQECPLISSYRLFPENHRISSATWLGYQKELLYEYLVGNSSVEFENLRPIVDIVSQKQSVVNLLQTRRTGKAMGTQIHYPPNKLIPGEKIVIVPKQDSQNHYQWLELHKHNQTTNQPEEECIISSRLTREGVSQKNWQGPERQLLADFSNGLIPFEALVNIPLKKTKGAQVYIWNEDGKQIYLLVSKRFGLEENDELELIPESQGENTVNFHLVKRGTVLGKYILNLITRKFVLDKILFQSVDGWFDVDTGTYTDSENQRWIPLSRIVQMFKTSYASLRLSLKAVESKTYNFKGAAVFYREEDSIRILEEKGIKRKDREEIKLITPEQANEYFRKLVEGI